MGRQTVPTIRWKPQPRQLTFLKAMGLARGFGQKLGPPQARLIGYGGSAGGGKTDALLMAGIIACLSYPGCQVGYFRRTFPELEGPGGAIQRSRILLAELADRKMVRYQASQHKWLFSTGAVLAFCHAQEEDSVYHYQSQQFDVLLIDEATHFSEFQIQYLLTRNRLTVKMPAALCAMGTNPGGVGHAWFKRLFIDVGLPEEVHENILSSGPVSTYFIPAKLADNPALERRDPNYRSMLEALPEHMRKQLLEGDWTGFSGQAFPDFNPSVHVIRPFKIPFWWKRWRANDPGYSDPFAFYWFAADQDGNVYCYREFTRGPNDPKLTYSEQAARVAALSIVGTEAGDAETEWDEASGAYVQVKERIEYTVTGMDAFSKHMDGKSIVDFYAQNGVENCIQPVHGGGARAQMKATLHEYLKIFPDAEGKPTSRMKIFATCKELIKSLPLLIEDDTDPEKVADINDHWYQACGYGCQSWHAERSKAPAQPETRLDRVWKFKKTLARRLKMARWDR